MKKTLLAALIITSTAGIAHANNSGFYIGAQAGGGLFSLGNPSLNSSFSNTTDVEGDTVKQTASGNSKSGSISGFSGVGAINLGYDFNPAYQIPIRAELSYTLRSKINDNKKDIAFSMTPTVEVNGQPVEEPQETITTKLNSLKTKASMDTLMLNGYYDISNNSDFTPYVGLGIGVAFRNLDSTEAFENADKSISLSRSDTHFAWRVGAGVGYQISENWTADFSVNYIDAGKMSISKSQETIYTDPEDGEQITVNGINTIMAKLSSIDFLLGVRYSF